MKSKDQNRDYQFLATAISLIAGYFAIRACYALPVAAELAMGLGVELSGLSRWLMEYSQWPLPIFVILSVFTLVSVWWRYPLHSLAVALGIVALSIGGHLINSGAQQPMIKMIQEMSY
ncbi:MAG: hypothetical protein AB8D78_14350 [Akkermansiaceae bacterium]